MPDELGYNDFLEYIEDLSRPWPFSDQAMRLFMDALAITLADDPVARTPQSYLPEGLQFQFVLNSR